MTRDVTQQGTTSPMRTKNVRDFKVEVHLFACGHGDTVVVRLPGPKWLLIDCHLPKTGGVYDRFLTFLDELAKREGAANFTRLDWVILTHPDTDHYLGMRSLLEHFSREGRSLGRWLSSGLNAHDVRSLVWPDEQTKRGYRELQECVQQLSSQGLIRRQIVHEDSRQFSPEGYVDCIDIFPIAPSARSIFAAAEADLPRLGQKQNVQIEANALSVVLVLSVKVNDVGCNFLLAGDAGPDELDEAVRNWHNRANEFNREKTIHVIKVPLHGSWASHLEFLPRQKGQDNGIAAVSAGTRDKLPDREVLRDYLHHEWDVVVTTRQTAGIRRTDHPMTLLDRRSTSVASIKRATEYDVTIEWHPLDGLKAGPPDAFISLADIHPYGTVVEESVRQPSA